MYFAQEYISLSLAVFISAGVAIAIIGLRAITLMKPGWAIVGVVFPAAAIMAITLAAAIWKPLQGILLTAEGLGFFNRRHVAHAHGPSRGRQFLGRSPGSDDACRKSKRQTKRRAGASFQ